MPDPGAPSLAAPARPTPADLSLGEVIEGSVERVVAHSPETGCCVLQARIAGRPDPVTLEGCLPAILPGERVTATGAWAGEAGLGAVFRARALQAAPPETAEEIERHLAAGPGIGPGIAPDLARRLVAAFGEATIAVIEDDPLRLREVPDLGPLQAHRIVAAWAERRGVRAVMGALHRHGAGMERATRLWKTYGADAVRVVEEDPYRLALEVPGFGFAAADALAARLGAGRTAEARLRAGLLFALRTAADEGHVALPVAALVGLARGLLGAEAGPVEAALAGAHRRGEVVLDAAGGEPCAFAPPLYRAERAVARRLAALARGAPPWAGLRADPAPDEAAGEALTPAQHGAARRLLAARLAVLLGGPGTGRTGVIRAALDPLTARGVRVRLTAPTGQAAQALAGRVGLEVQPLRALLEAGPHAAPRGAPPLACDLLVVLEAEALDVPAVDALTRALPHGAALWLVGDPDGLASAGPGEVLADLAASGRAAVARLAEPLGQAEAGGLVAGAHRIARGLTPEPAGDDAAEGLHVVEVDTPEEGLARLVALVTDGLPRRFGLDPARDVQVLAPAERGVLGALNLNRRLQAALNPEPSTLVERFGWRFGVGDPVMAARDDPGRGVPRGRHGRITHLDEEGALVVGFEEGEAAYGPGELDLLVPAYAVTVQEAQGARFPAVVVPVVTSHHGALSRELLHTAVTRAGRLAVIVGQRQALAMAVRATRGRRWTKLADWLRA